MPIYLVKCDGLVRRIYEIEAPSEDVARETAHINEPADETEQEFKVVSVVKMKPKG